MNHLLTVIGECGPKIGFDGMDTGFIRFDNYRVDRDSLLDRFGFVDEDGNYSSPIKSNGKRLANSIACLTTGRIFVARSSSESAAISCITAIRYAFKRRQFGTIGEEKQLINYPMHQFRLFPRFCTSIVNYLSTLWMLDKWFECLPTLHEEGNKNANLCHSLSSVCKAYIPWLGRNTISECRQACGAFGYTMHSLFGKIDEINDLNHTWEGDSNVLLIQVQRFLLNSLKSKMSDGTVTETLEFLGDELPNITKFEGDITDINKLIDVFSIRANYLVHSAAIKLMSDPSKTVEIFNDIQPFELTDMCRAYYDHFVCTKFYDYIQDMKDENTYKVFSKILLLHTLFTITQQTHYFSKIFNKDQFAKITEEMIDLCADLRKEILKLTYLLPFPNLGMGVLGNEDMQVYSRLKVMRELINSKQ